MMFVIGWFVDSGMDILFVDFALYLKTISGIVLLTIYCSLPTHLDATNHIKQPSHTKR